MSLITSIFGGKDYTSGKMSWWNVWSRVYLNSISNDESYSFPERGYNMYTTDSALLSGKENIAVVYSIDGNPRRLPYGFRATLRGYLHPSMRLNFISSHIPTIIDWGSPEMKARLKNYRKNSQDINSQSDNVYDQHESRSEISQTSWRDESVNYLSNATSSERQLQMFDYRSYMIVTGTRGSDFDTALARIEGYCTSRNLVINRITRDLPGFLSSFSPFSLDMDSKQVSRVGKSVLPDEIVSRFTGYTQGKVGSGGVYIATDVDTRFPILKYFKRDDTDPENVAILGSTGSGKSFVGKSIVFGLFSNPRTRGTIMDIEGFEYIPLMNFFANNDSVVILNMAEGQGSYFDPVPIIVTGNYALDVKDNNCYALSVSYTTSILKVLVGEDVLEKYTWASDIVETALSDLYASVGVSQAVYETWGRSADLTLHDVYRIIKQTHERVLSGEDKSYHSSNKEYLAALDIVRSRLSRYFETPENGGTKSYVFSNRIPIETIARSKFVLCSFGMKSKGKNQVDPIQMALTQISAANVSHLRSLFCKIDGKFNVKIWEELQRWADFPGSDAILSVALTGGRKMGDINFLMSNEPKMFLGMGAKLDIFSNITSFLIGAIPDVTVRHDVAKTLGVDNLIPELDKIANSVSSEEAYNQARTLDVKERSPYSKAFVINLDRTITTVGRVELPNEISMSSIFRTGSEESEESLEGTQSLETLGSPNFYADVVPTSEGNVSDWFVDIE